MIVRRFTAILMAVALAAPTVAGAQGVPPPPAGAPPAPPPQIEQDAVTPTPVDPDVTPARLSHLHGAVSFYRPGAEDWAPAALNMPLAPGDALYTGPTGNVEIQVGQQAFIRAAQETQLGLDNQEADFVQVRVTLGHAAIDAGRLPQGTTIEVDTPNGAFTIEQAGYYRVDVTDEWAALAVHRGGQASVTTAGGGDTPILSGQQGLVRGTDAPVAYVRPAQALDAWDHWNQTRTAEFRQGESARYVAGSMYGTEALDRYGTWQVDASYGRIWMPSGVSVGWVPYSTGRWIWDSRFGWTWLDDSPWGWAPYHYGRWVFVRGHWAWAPGPVVVRAVYAPALVVFLGARTAGRPLCWAALGWGEPVIPWWGRPGFVGVVTWAGWGGPRVVNNVVVNRTTVNVTNVTVYRNVQVTRAVVGLPSERFGRGDGRPVRIAAADVPHLQPVRGAPRVRPVAASVTPTRERAVAPPEASRRREVVGTRKPHDPTPDVRAVGLPARTVDAPTPGMRVVVPQARRDGRGREGAPTTRERERDERGPGPGREQRGRQADVNRESPPQRPPAVGPERRGPEPDVNREPPRGRQADVNREPPQRPPAVREPGGPPAGAGQQPPPRPQAPGREPRGRQPDADREQPQQRPPAVGREPRGRQPDTSRVEPQQRPPAPGHDPRGRQPDVNSVQPQQRPPAPGHDPRGRQPDVNSVQPQQRPPEAWRDQRGRQVDPGRGPQPQRPPDVNREPPRGQAGASRPQPHPQQPPDAPRGEERRIAPPPSGAPPAGGGAQPRGRPREQRDDAERPAGAPRRQDSVAPRQPDGAGEPRREQGARPSAPRSGQPAGRPQQNDGADDGRNRPAARPGPSSQVPTAPRRASQRAVPPAGAQPTVGGPARQVPLGSAAPADARGNAAPGAQKRRPARE